MDWVELEWTDRNWKNSWMIFIKVDWNKLDYSGLHLNRKKSGVEKSGIELWFGLNYIILEWVDWNGMIWNGIGVELNGTK